MRLILAGLALLTQVFASTPAHALELGGLTVASKLNEPLKATIEVRGIATDSAANTLVVSSLPRKPTRPPEFLWIRRPPV